MAYGASVDTSAVLDQLMYLIAGQEINTGSKPRVKDILNGVCASSEEKAVLQEILNNNPGIGELRMVDTSWAKGGYGTSNKNDGMYAATFETPGGDVYVSYRGTGDGGWKYNAAAYGTERSQMQQWALDYFNRTVEKNYEGKGKQDLYVTGHSQGGNNAQFVTLFSDYSDYIKYCYSVDGPGFSEEVVEEAKRRWGEAYFERQVGKMYAYNGEKDYVHQQGEVQLIPSGRTTIIATPDAAGVDPNGWHAIRYMLGKNGFNAEAQESELSKFMTEFVAKVNELPQEQRLDAANAVMALIENKQGSGDAKLTTDDMKNLKQALAPVIVEILEDCPERIVPLLLELGLDERTAEAIADLVGHINSYPPEVREDIVRGILEPLSYNNETKDFDYDWTKLPAGTMILEAWPVLLETLITHPDDIGVILHELGVDAAIENWIKENPWQVVGIAFVLGLTALYWLPKVLIAAGVVIGVGLLLDAAIRIVQGIQAIGNKLKEIMVTVFNAVKNVVNAVVQWFRNTFNAGVRYANSNPYFKVDTAKLRGYAARIENVNRRLRNLDGNLRWLYGQVGWQDIGDILYANLVTSGSPTLNQVKAYLNNTADRFDMAENRVKGYMGS